MNADERQARAEAREATDAPESTDAPETTDAPESTPDASATRSAASRWVFAVVAGVFGLLYAYDLWEGVGNFVGVGGQAAALGIGISTWGLTVLVIGLVAPLAVFAGAFWLAHRRGALAVLLLFLTGWAVVQVVQLDLEVLFGLGGYDFGS
ncbi:hypothetical protein ARHIZOSPH14_27990 [Agromyces rhizosphaerae]|uniref:Uncharacterized protein n=1 Tax=Agromyces rhizosphaerae TaxID=88374 RepID=A0A9W6CXQ5_9MICO|nr:hypothetical protein [Agromyces rhizosphaerae]GLI28557.1 hypothetical protein ARHIZOSPH14_27990 [Agromyces rhizosphaerae]